MNKTVRKLTAAEMATTGLDFLNDLNLNVVTINKKAEKLSKLTGISVEIIIDCFAQATANGNPDVGSTTNKNTTHFALYYCPDKASKALIQHFKLNKEQIGTAKYVGLVPTLASKLNNTKSYNFNTDGKDVLVSLISEDMVEALIEEMKSCDLFDEDNLRKIIWDLTVIYRMYQEKIIDSAKKAYIVEILISIDCYRPLSLQKINYLMTYGEDDTLKMDEEEKSKIDPLAGSLEDGFFIYKKVPTKTLKDGSKRLFFRDPISEIQKALAIHLTNVIKHVNKIVVAMPESEIERLLSYEGEGPVADLTQSVKYAYNVFSTENRESMSKIDKDSQEDLYKSTKEAYNKSLDVVKILARQLLDGYSPEDACSIMQLIACMSQGVGNNGPVFNPASTNQLPITLLKEEYMTMVKNTTAQVKVMGYPLLFNAGLKEGDVVEFVNGVTENGSILNFGKELINATGTFEIINFNGQLFATKDLTFNIPKPDYTKRVFFVKNRKNMDVDAIVDELCEGSKITIKKDGTIKKQDQVIAEVKFEGEGGIDKLLGVYGEVTYLKVATTSRDQLVIMFELSNVEKLVATVEEQLKAEDIEFIGSSVEEDDIEISYSGNSKSVEVDADGNVTDDDLEALLNSEIGNLY